jgi:hypothetical protein
MVATTVAVATAMVRNMGPPGTVSGTARYRQRAPAETR